MREKRIDWLFFSDWNFFFQIFRETKESEIQNLLRAKRDLESKIPKLNQEFMSDSYDDNDSPESGLDSVGKYSCLFYFIFPYMLILLSVDEILLLSFVN